VPPADDFTPFLNTVRARGDPTANHPRWRELLGGFPNPICSHSPMVLARTRPVKRRPACERPALGDPRGRRRPSGARNLRLTPPCRQS